MFWKSKTDKLFDRAVSYQQNHGFDRALSLYDEILAIDSRCTDAWVNKGNILGQQGDYEEAIKCYQQALALAQARKEVILRSIGMIEHIRGNLESATSFHRQAIEENPTYGLAWLGLIQALLSAGMGTEAQAQCTMFALRCTVGDKEIYFKAKRLVDQFLATGAIGGPAEWNERWRG